MPLIAASIMIWFILVYCQDHKTSSEDRKVSLKIVKTLPLTGVTILDSERLHWCEDARPVGGDGEGEGETQRGGAGTPLHTVNLIHDDAIF